MGGSDPNDLMLNKAPWFYETLFIGIYAATFGLRWLFSGKYSLATKGKINVINEKKKVKKAKKETKQIEGLKKGGTIKKGYRFAKGGRVVKAKK